MGCGPGGGYARLPPWLRDWEDLAISLIMVLKPDQLNRYWTLSQELVKFENFLSSLVVPVFEIMSFIHSLILG